MCPNDRNKTGGFEAFTIEIGNVRPYFSNLIRYDGPGRTDEPSNSWLTKSEGSKGDTN